MIQGAHVILYSNDPQADREFLRDLLRTPAADAGGGWMIYALPPAEIAVHPGQENGTHELYFMCDDIHAFVNEMTKRGVPNSPVQEERWGSLTRITLPGGGKLGVYQPKHASPIGANAKKS
jgi:hypothetical protein